jgi:uncharacterized protein (DUF433 family)
MCWNTLLRGSEAKFSCGKEIGPMNERIVIDPHIQHGKPVIRGTRVPVARVIGSLAGGMTPEDICQDYEIEEADLRAALQYAAELIDAEQVYPLPPPAA